MANNITPKLRAYVQTDATGRVVSGTPVFRSSKPKSGNWKEIPMYYRGSGLTTTTTTTNNNPSTTTTSTSHSGGGGGNTVTAFVKSYWAARVLACSATSTGMLLFYSSSSTLTLGSTVFTDATLTTPVPEGYVISIDMGTAYMVNAQGALSTYNCGDVNSYYVSANVNNACLQNDQYFDIAGNVAAGYDVSGNFLGRGYGVGQLIYIRYVEPGNQGYVIGYQVTGNYTASSVTAGASCSQTNSSVFKQIPSSSGNPNDVCAQSPSLTLYYSGVFGNGVAVYTDSGLTQGYYDFSYIADPATGGVYSTSNGIAFGMYGQCQHVDFTVASTCDGFAGYNPIMTINNFSGTSMGIVYACVIPQLSRQAALDNIYTGTTYSNSNPVTSGTGGGWVVGQTYWTAVQDVYDSTNVRAKAFTVTSCPNP